MASIRNLTTSTLSVPALNGRHVEPDEAGRIRRIGFDIRRTAFRIARPSQGRRRLCQNCGSAEDQHHDGCDEPEHRAANIDQRSGKAGHECAGQRANAK